MMVLFGGATLEELRMRWTAPTARLQAVLDDLVASGDVSFRGRGKRRFAVAR